MARVRVDEAYIRLQVDDGGAERTAAEAGDRAGRAFARAAARAARDIDVSWNVNERALQRQLDRIDADVTATAVLDDDRVRADLNRLAQETLTIPAELRLDGEQQLRRQLDLLATDTVTIDALVELADQDARTQLALLGQEQVTIPATIDLDRAGLNTELDAIRALTDVTIPATVELDEASLKVAQERINTADATITADVDVQRLAPVRIPGRVEINREQVREEVARLGNIRLGVDEAAIAAQVAAGIRAGEALAGDVGGNVNVGLAGLARARAQLAVFSRALPPVRLRTTFDTAALRRQIAALNQATAGTGGGRRSLVPGIGRTLVGLTQIASSLGRITQRARRLSGVFDRVFRLDRYEAEFRDIQDELDRLSRPRGGDTRSIEIDVNPRTLEQALGPNGTLEQQLRSRTLRVDVDVDDNTLSDRLSGAYRRFYDDSGNARLDVEANLDEGSVRAAQARTEQLLSDATVRIRARLDEDATVQARLRELGRGIDIPVRFRPIDDSALQAALRALRGVDLHIRLKVDDDALRAELRRIEQQDLSLSASITLLTGDLDAELAGVRRTRPIELTATIDLDTSRLDLELAGLRRTPVVELRATIDLDPSRFDLELAGLRRTRLHIDATINLIPAQFDAELASLRRTTLSLDATLDLDPASFLAQVRALEPLRLRAVLDIDRNLSVAGLEPVRLRTHLEVNRAHFAAQVAALQPVRIRADVDVDRNRVQDALNGLFAGGGSGGGSGGGGLFGGLGRLPGLLTGAVGPIVQISALLLAASGIATALAVAGAAITAAYGAAATAVAALPAVLALAAAPIAAVMLGMEGIQNAARTLEPEFTALRTAVSGTFEQGLIPVFERFRGLFPGLTTALQGTATALISIADMVSRFLTSSMGVALVETMFANINTAITNLAPGITDITIALLTVASQSGAFDAITTAVNTFGTAFRESVQGLVSDGTLAAAFSGLEGLLGSLATAFVALVENGIRVFANAAPGLSAVIDAITNFFNRFDYNALGTAVGNVFGGLAEAINRVPTSTIDAIVAAFEDLGRSFQNPVIQDGIAQIFDLIPPLIGAIDAGVQAFARMGIAAEGLGIIWQGVAAGLSSVFAAAQDPLAFFRGELQTGFDEAGRLIQEGGARIGDAFVSSTREFGPLGAAAIDTGIGQINNAAETGLAGVGPNAAAVMAGSIDTLGSTTASGLQGVAGIAATEAGGIATGVQSGLANVPGATQEIVGQVAPIIESSFKGLSGYAELGMLSVVDAVRGSGGAIGKAVQDSLAQLPEQLQLALSTIDGVLLNAVASWGVTLGVGVGQMAINVVAGTQGIAVAMQQGLAAVDAVIINGTASWAVSIGVGFGQIAIASQTGWQGVAFAANTGLTFVNSTIIAGVGVWALSVQLGFQGITTAALNGWLQVSVTAALGLAQVNVTIQTGVAVWAFTITAGMAQVAAASLGGWVQVAIAASTGIMQVNATIMTGVGLWALSIQAGMVTVGASVTTGFVQVGATVAAAMAGVNAAIQAGVAAWAASTQAGVAQIGAGVTLGFAVIGQAVVAAMAQATVTITAGVRAWSAAVQAGMAVVTSVTVVGFASVVKAAQTSMQQATAAIDAGSKAWPRSVQGAVQNAVAAANSGVPGMRAAGANMGQALADGLNSRVGAVQAAASRLANAAAAATRAAAQIRSPSRVFARLGDYMGEGLADGLEGSEGRIIRSAAALVDRVAGEAARVGGAVSDGVTAAVRDADTQLARLGQSTANVSVSAGGVDVTGGSLVVDSGGDGIDYRRLGAEIADALAPVVRDVAAGGDVNVNVSNYNPVGVSDVDELNRDLRQLSTIGVLPRRGG